jgi:hypothetical protein
MIIAGVRAGEGSWNSALCAKLKRGRKIREGIL